MKHRLADLPALRTEPARIDAVRFNRVRVALARLGAPLRWPLPDLRGLDVYLDVDAWVCGDRTLNDFPVVAWTAFDLRGREGLHAPVRCTVRYYHLHAGIIVDSVLGNVDAVLEHRLAADVGASPVSALRRDGH